MIRIQLNPETSISNFIFDITGINATQASVMQIPYGGTLPLAVDGFDVSTTTHVLSNGETVSRLLGYTDIESSLIDYESSIGGTVYFIQIQFDDVRYNNVIDLVQENLQASYFGLDLEVENIGSSIIPDRVHGCLDENSVNYNQWATNDCLGENDSSSCLYSNIYDCNLSCCEYDFDEIPFLNLLNQYMYVGDFPLGQPSLDTWLRNQTTSNLQTYLPGLLDPNGTVLNTDWAIQWYGLGVEYQISDNFGFLNQFYNGTQDNNLYPESQTFDDLDHWLNVKLTNELGGFHNTRPIDANTTNLTNQLNDLLDPERMNSYGLTNHLNTSWAEKHYYLVDRYKFLLEFLLGRGRTYSFWTEPNEEGHFHESLSHWLVYLILTRQISIDGMSEVLNRGRLIDSEGSMLNKVWAKDWYNFDPEWCLAIYSTSQEFLDFQDVDNPEFLTVLESFLFPPDDVSYLDSDDTPYSNLDQWLTATIETEEQVEELLPNFISECPSNVFNTLNPLENYYSESFIDGDQLVFKSSNGYDLILIIISSMYYLINSETGGVEFPMTTDITIPTGAAFEFWPAYREEYGEFNFS
mgnify:CR=1 FL=1